MRVEGPHVQLNREEAQAGDDGDELLKQGARRDQSEEADEQELAPELDKLPPAKEWGASTPSLRACVTLGSMSAPVIARVVAIREECQGATELRRLALPEQRGAALIEQPSVPNRK